MSRAPAGLLDSMRRRPGRPRLGGSESRTLRVQRGSFVRPYGARISDCISAASRASGESRSARPLGPGQLPMTPSFKRWMLRPEVGSCASERKLRSLAGPCDPSPDLVVSPEREDRPARAGGRIRSSCSGISRSAGNAIRSLRAIGALSHPRAAPQGREAYSRTR